MSLENRMLLKGTTRKITSQERWFLSFFKPLISVGLPLMTPLVKSVLVPFGLMVAASGTDSFTQPFKRNVLDREYQH